MDQDNEFSKSGGEFDAPDPNPYAATQQSLSFDQGTKNIVLADRGSRLAAVLLDGVLVFGVVVVLGILAAVILPSARFSFGAELAALVGGVILLAVIGFAVVQLVLIARYGQTMGKRIMKIRVVRTGTDEKCGLGRYFWLRWFVIGLLGSIPAIGIIFSLVDTLMIFSNDRRCLHDHIADTQVIRV